jgi:hypothetical protein
MSRKRDRERKPDLLAQNPLAPAAASAPSSVPVAAAKPTGSFVRHSYDANGELTSSDAA